MANVTIVVEEKLGGQIAFGGKEIRVLKATYDAVPIDKTSEFDAILIQAQDVYQAKVAEAKKAGQRPQASKLKAEAIAEVVTPFLEANAVSKGSVSRTTKVVKPSVGTRESRLKKDTQTPVDKETLQRELDNFPADLLDDSSEEVKKPKVQDAFADLDEELGLDDVFDDGDEELFSSSPSKDPFAGEGDAFDDIDLDI